MVQRWSSRPQDRCVCACYSLDGEGPLKAWWPRLVEPLKMGPARRSLIARSVPLKRIMGLCPPGFTFSEAIKFRWLGGCVQFKRSSISYKCKCVCAHMYACLCLCVLEHACAFERMQVYLCTSDSAPEKTAKRVVYSGKTQKVWQLM